MCQPDEPAVPTAEHDSPPLLLLYEAELDTSFGCAGEQQSLTRLYELDQRTQTLCREEQSVLLSWRAVLAVRRCNGDASGRWHAHGRRALILA